MMREAVIVAGARTPVGKADKGTLANMRPDDLGVGGQAPHEAAVLPGQRSSGITFSANSRSDVSSG
ncbi:MAG: hypothetical protein LOD92_01165 [Bacillales bacterium]